MCLAATKEGIQRLSERFQQEREFFEHLELGQSNPKQRDDLIIEALSNDPMISRSGLIKKIAQYLNQPLISLEYLPNQCYLYSQSYQLMIIQTDRSILLKQDSPQQVCLYMWQADELQKQKLRPRQLKQTLERFVDPEQEIELWGIAKTAPLQTFVSATPIQRLIQLVGLEKKTLVLIFFYSLSLGFLGLAVPIASQSLVNNVAFGALRQALAALTVILMLVLGFLTLMKSLQLILVEMLQRRIFVRVAQLTAQRLLQVQSQVFDQNRLSEVVNRFFDVVTVQKAASFLLLDGLGILLATVTGMLLLAFYHPLLLVFDILLLLGVLFVIFVLGIGSQATSIKESSAKYRMAAWLEELASHPLLFKPNVGSTYAMRQTDSLLDNYLQARKKHFRVLLRQNIGAFSLQAIAATSLLALGGWLVIEGELSIGQLVAAELVVANIVNSFAKIGKHLETWYDLMAAMDKLGYIFDLPAEKLNLGFLSTENHPAHIELKNMSYLSPEHPNSLKNIELNLKPGTRSAILGANHWESHLLLEILYGFRQASQGLVLIDDQALHGMLLSALRTQVVMIRELELINASLLDNLRLGKADLSRFEAHAILRKVGLEGPLQGLPEGLDTLIRFNGSPFSNAEAYRLMLARALIMAPRFLILDGVLDQIGWQVHGPVSKTLFDDIRSQTTLLVVTNQIEILKHFDSVYYFPQAGQLSLAPATLYTSETPS